jgi:hypothetical protein
MKLTALQPLHSLEECMEGEQRILKVTNGCIAFPYLWQVPAATEKAAFEAVIKANGLGKNMLFVGFPWATLIDALSRRSARLSVLLNGLEQLAEALSATNLPVRRLSVAQHIHAQQFISLFKALGITDLFWSHAIESQKQAEGIALHPFPLFPAQAPVALYNEQRLTSRRHLANFIGAYSPGLYPSNLRQVIFDDAGSESDLLIIKRDTWHFDRAVYVEQMHGQLATDEQAEREREETKEYLDSIRQSWFTLCPTGSGPNSIRIFEALALGSIPVVLTKSLRLPGPRALWEKAALFEDDSEAGYRRVIARARQMSTAARHNMIAEGATLFELVGPRGYAGLVMSNIQPTSIHERVS